MNIDQSVLINIKTIIKVNNLNLFLKFYFDAVVSQSYGENTEAARDQNNKHGGECGGPLPEADSKAHGNIWKQ